MENNTSNKQRDNIWANHYFHCVCVCVPLHLSARFHISMYRFTCLIFYAYNFRVSLFIDLLVYLFVSPCAHVVSPTHLGAFKCVSVLMRTPHLSIFCYKHVQCVHVAKLLCIYAWRYWLILYVCVTFIVVFIKAVFAFENKVGLFVFV